MFSWKTVAVLSAGAVLPAAGMEWDEFVSGEVGLPCESKVLSYGLPDSDEPNLLPYGKATFMKTLSVGGKFYIDTTNIGNRTGRGNRAWDCWEIDIPTELRHQFGPDDADWLPTAVELGVGYRYEYHPSRTEIDDTQFVVADIALTDLWIVPRFSYERDVERDRGTYLNLALSHDFEIAESVHLEPSVSQGWGDVHRVNGYLSKPSLDGPLDRSGLMDSRIQLSVRWDITDCLCLSGYVAYGDFIFDRHIREASRNYMRQVDGGKRNASWTFPAGVCVKYAF